MATETAFRPSVDQENAQALNIKGGNVSGIKLKLLVVGCKKPLGEIPTRFIISTCKTTGTHLTMLFIFVVFDFTQVEVLVLQNLSSQTMHL